MKICLRTKQEEKRQRKVYRKEDKRRKKNYYGPTFESSDRSYPEENYQKQQNQIV